MRRMELSGPRLGLPKMRLLGGVAFAAYVKNCCFPRPQFCNARPASRNMTHRQFPPLYFDGQLLPGCDVRAEPPKMLLPVLEY